MLNSGYIERPEGNFLNTGTGEKIAYIKGNLKISLKGKAYIENLEAQEKQTRKSTIRYWITTIIAIIALAKSFQSEIMAAMEQVLKLLKQ